MFGNIEILSLASAKASHAAERQSVIARNVANADTPGYRAQDISAFAESYKDAHRALKATRSGHLQAAAFRAQPNVMIRNGVDEASPNGNSVSLETEMMKAAEVRHQHDLALSVYQKSIGILKTSLGRGR